MHDTLFSSLLYTLDSRKYGTLRSFCESFTLNDFHDDDASSVCTRALKLGSACSNVELVQQQLKPLSASK